jgi:hypothetical protein
VLVLVLVLALVEMNQLLELWSLTQNLDSLLAESELWRSLLLKHHRKPCA